MTILSSLQKGYSVRHPTEEDIPAILDVMYELDKVEVGEASREDADYILSDWENMDPKRDAWVVVAPDGLLCGYATLTLESETGPCIADGYVHPAHYDHGIGSTIVELTEARAVELLPSQTEGVRLVLVNNILAHSEAARNLLETRGYTLVRVYFRMYITVDKPPSPPVWPTGITVRTCNGSAEDIHRAYDTVEESFKDHWAHTPRTFKYWQSHMVREGFDPTLWFLACEDDEMVGAALCFRREDGDGWVTQIAVRRPWRKQGIGEALLRHAFSVFYQRGIAHIGLGVDGQSLTGAQRLYERVGMHVAMRIGRYEKEIRAM